MLHVTVPNMPETLTYAVLASLGLDLVIALLLAVHGDWLGVLLVLAVFLAGYRFLCRDRLAVLGAPSIAGCSAVLLLLCALVELAAGFPYYGILFLLGAAVIGLVYLLLLQGAVPAECGSAASSRSAAADTRRCCACSWSCATPVS
jgi:hypothetical protein